MRFTKSQLKRVVREAILREDVEMQDELTRIINTLGVGQEVNKSTLGAALKAGDRRSAKHNLVLADLFLAILNNPDMMTKIIPLLKKAAEETVENEK
jgi:hypothetical protein